MTDLLPATELTRIRAAVDAALPAFLVDLEHLVNIDCGSYTKAGVDQVGAWVGRFLGDLGAAIEVVPDAMYGDTVVATFEGTAPGPTLLLIGHMDTVFDSGHRRRAAVPGGGRHRVRPGCDGHEGWSADGPVRAQGAAGPGG